jgi:hypothetical protein
MTELAGRWAQAVPEACEVAGMDGAAGAADLERYAGHYERTSRRFDVSVRDGRLAMARPTST